MTQAEKAHLQLSTKGKLGDAQLRLNGEDIGQWVSCIGIVWNAKERMPQVYLTLDVFGGLDVDLADTDPSVTESSRKALMALGWTPPEEKT